MIVFISPNHQLFPLHFFIMLECFSQEVEVSYIEQTLVKLRLLPFVSSSIVVVVFEITR